MFSLVTFSLLIPFLDHIYRTDGFEESPAVLAMSAVFLFYYLSLPCGLPFFACMSDVRICPALDWASAGAV